MLYTLYSARSLRSLVRIEVIKPLFVYLDPNNDTLLCSRRRGILISPDLINRLWFQVCLVQRLIKIVWSLIKIFKSFLLGSRLVWSLIKIFKLFLLGSRRFLLGSRRFLLGSRQFLLGSRLNNVYRIIMSLLASRWSHNRFILLKILTHSLRSFVRIFAK